MKLRRIFECIFECFGLRFGALLKCLKIFEKRRMKSLKNIDFRFRCTNWKFKTLASLLCKFTLVFWISPAFASNRPAKAIIKYFRCFWPDWRQTNERNSIWMVIRPQLCNICPNPMHLSTVISRPPPLFANGERRLKTLEFRSLTFYDWWPQFCCWEICISLIWIAWMPMQKKVRIHLSTFYSSIFFVFLRLFTSDFSSRKTVEEFWIWISK